jgi:hypothetical protein
MKFHDYNSSYLGIMWTIYTLEMPKYCPGAYLLSSLGGSDEEKKAGAREIRDKIKHQVLSFLSQLGIEADITQ